MPFTEQDLTEAIAINAEIVVLQSQIDGLTAFKSVLDSGPAAKYTAELVTRYYELHKDKTETTLPVDTNTVTPILAAIAILLTDLNARIAVKQAAFAAICP